MRGCFATTLVSCFALFAVNNPLFAEGDAQGRLAAITTVYKHNSHADVIFSRYLKTDTLDGRGNRLPFRLASVHVLQKPDGDLSEPFGKEHNVPRVDSVKAALTPGGDDLSVDGVLIVAEHGKFPRSKIGQMQYPKRRLFAEVAGVMERSHRSVPVFIDKMLSDNWEDASWIYERAERLQIPLMAGSSLPSAWRFPPIDMPRDANVKRLIVVSYGHPDSYGFHALEVLQCLAERRRGGETGVESVESLVGDEAWSAMEEPAFDRELLEACLARQDRKLKPGVPLKRLVREPLIYRVAYRDGVVADVITLNGAVRQWAAAWRMQDGAISSALFWNQDQRPYAHFTHLLAGVNQMMATGRPAWPVERTLLTTGILNAAFQSRFDGKAISTPHLDVQYRTKWNWSQPRWPVNEPPRSGGAPK